jgi:hypothetical protein
MLTVEQRPCRAEVEVRRMFQRTLGGWAMDLLALRRAGLDTPGRRAGTDRPLMGPGLGWASALDRPGREGERARAA